MNNPWKFYKQLEEETEPVAKQLSTMWHRYGRYPGNTCGNCDHLIASQGRSKSYYKCNLYGNSASTATDWRKKWTACGEFTESEK